MTNPRVTQLWRYPVKSMQGGQENTLSVGTIGVEGDRCFATRDEVRGGIRGAKQLGDLMRFRARWADGSQEVAIITLPSGDEVRTDAADVDEQLSKALDHPVTLWPLQPASNTEHYRRGKPDDPDPIKSLRAVFALEPDEPLPDLSGLPPDVFRYESPPGTYVDAFPLLIVTESSLAAFAALTPDSAIDVRRFRPNIVIGAADAGFAEDGWVGRRLRIGTMTARVEIRTMRCIMVTRPFADLPADRSIMRTLVRERSQCLGVYASVEQPGVVSVGDAVEILD
jgi:MOSC domain-containing protein